MRVSESWAWRSKKGREEDVEVEVEVEERGFESIKDMVCILIL